MRAFGGGKIAPNLGAFVKLRVGHFALSAFLVFRWYGVVRDTFRTILGVRFYISDLEGLLDLVESGGLIVFPSAPVMVRLADDAAHRDAMEGADLAVTDSAYMVILWLLRTGERVRRISGLRLLRGLFGRGDFRAKGDTFWVMPSSADSEANLAWLRGEGFEVSEDDTYVAPMYPRTGPIADDKLLEILGARRPRLVFVALSGGVQERLGADLRRRLGYKPAILCIGGAIAFLSGRQTGIPVWADRLALGWLLRLVSNPVAFSAKLRGVERLAPMIWRYGSGSVRPD
jgi:UDP-N-acetyl-D-mannosaminuronic acid transferase (WecB/TagA/CpsF family)